jgi:transglutaminase-like putative cysteine protease
VRIGIGCEFVFDLPLAAHAVVLVEPHPDERHRIDGALIRTEPELPSSVYADAFGNLCRRVTLPTGRVSLTYGAIAFAERVVDDADEGAPELSPDQLPDDVLVHLLPSRYCQSDELAQFALEQFGHLPRGWGRVHAISQWVHDAVAFDYMAASPLATSRDVLACRTGVCRDFAHLGISFCRALNIPARYVFGYMPDIDVIPPPGPMDFCGWMEVYLGGRWYTFDPRNHQRRVGRVVIARGRDAADVAMVTTFGRADLVSMTVQAEELAD